jgi:hypothetical protein
MSRKCRRSAVSRFPTRRLRRGRESGPEIRTDCAGRLRGNQPSGNDIRHPGEIAIAAAGKKPWLWRVIR